MAALGALAAKVSHEINNPLTSVLVNVELVLRRLRAVSVSDDPARMLREAPALDVLVDAARPGRRCRRTGARHHP